MEGAGGIGGLLAASKKTGTSIDLGYLYDGNGNITQLFDLSDGSEEGHYEYDPFGKEIAASGNQSEWNKFRFSTKYLEDVVIDASNGAKLGLYYYGYRYYSPRLGRWVNRDPIQEKGSPAYQWQQAKEAVELKQRIDGVLSKVSFGEYLSDEQLDRLLFTITTWIEARDSALSGNEALNLLAFVANNPLGDTDVLGLISSLNKCFDSPANFVMCLDCKIMDWGKVTSKYAGKKGSEKLVKLLQKWGGKVVTGGKHGVKVQFGTKPPIPIPTNPAAGTVKSIIKTALSYL